MATTREFKQKNFRLSIIAISLMSSFPAISAAENNGPNEIKTIESPGLEIVVVTAEKRKTTAQKTPLAITAISATALEQRGISDTKNLSGIVPSVHISEQSRDTSISIRGVSSTNVAPSQDPSVSFNVDGIYFPRPTGANGAFYDVERVEILRGPQGTLWGRNSTAGAINVITKKPVFNEVSGNVDFAVGDYSAKTLHGTLNLPISDTVAARASVLFNKHDGYTKNTGGGAALDDADETAARLHVLLKPIDKFQLLLSADTYERLGTGSAVRPTGFYTPSTSTYQNGLSLGLASKESVSTNFTQKFINRNSGIGAEATYSFDKFDLVSVTSYRSALMDFIADGDYSAAPIAVFRLYEPNTSFSQELRLASTSNEGLKWVSGLYYSQEKNHDDVFVSFGQNTIDPVNGFKFLQPNVQAKSTAIFGQASIPISNEVNLTLGARYTSDRRSSTNQSDEAILFSAPPTPKADTKYSANKVTWRVGSDWNITESSMLYANLSTGYKSGGFSSLGSYKPETIRSFEFGSKNRFFSNRFELNFTAFDYAYEDLQLTQLVALGNGASLGVTVNAASAKVRGLEIEFNAKPTANVKLFGNLSILDAKFNSYPNAYERLTGGTLDVSGNYLPRAPKFSLNLGASYDYKLDTAIITSRFETRYVDKYYLTEFNGLKNAGGVSGLDAYSDLAVQKAHTHSRISFHYTPNDADWYGEIYANNLENIRTLDAVLMATPAGSISASYGAPRTVGVKFGYNF